MANKFLTALFGDYSKKEVKRVKKTADKVIALESKYQAMDDKELANQTVLFKERLANGETLDDILPEAFAVCREGAWRVLGMKHFPVQIIGGIVLHQGRIAEMKTGEGKTLVATLPAYLNALNGEGVHIVTVNDYLAKRDSEWMGKLYRFLGLEVGLIIHEKTNSQRREAYNADITYGTNNEMGFDYLRDNMVQYKEEKVQRGHKFAIVDEVDSILIDEARTPLIISGKGEQSTDLYRQANNFAKTLKMVKVAKMDEKQDTESTYDGDYIVDEKAKTATLTQDGVKKAEQYFNVENLMEIDNSTLLHHINQAIKANGVMRRDIDYVVADGQVKIVDEFPGRIMEGRRYNEGLHQAIEAKENVKVEHESKTLATITFQNYFRLYGKLSGMTGTASTEAPEFSEIYKLDVVEIPTNKPLARIDNPDVIFQTEQGKFHNAIEQIKKCHEKGQPVLVGTISIEKSELLSKMLKKARVPHNVLNAKNHEREAEIIAQAGKLGAVTIATNMAGRGTDIMLGGNAEYSAKERMEKNGYSEEIIAEATSYATITDPEILKAREEYQRYYEQFKQITDKEKEEVKALGGLRIVGTCRNDSRRIDDQLRGRSGRQGDPGSSVFYLSMEDDMLRVFGGETMQNIANKFSFEEDQAIELNLLTKQIEHAQARIESRDFSIRKSVLAYDDVMNVQRNLIYEQRNKVLDGLDMSNQIEKMIIEQVELICNNYIDMTVGYMSWDYEGFNNALEQRVLADGTNIITEELCSVYNAVKIRDAILDEVFKQYDKKVADAQENGFDFQEVERAVLLRNVDTKWMDHIDSLHRLRKGIGLMAYGQKDPVIAYKNNAIDMFDEMIDAINRDTVTTLCKGVLRANVERKQVAEESGTNQNSTVVNKDKKIGRNDMCPCGSGRKYKNCCGK